MKRRTTVPAHFDRHDLDSDGFTSPLARAAGTTLARAIHGAAADANDVCLDLAIPPEPPLVCVEDIPLLAMSPDDDWQLPPVMCK
jgi:hypothetical protein